MKEIKYPIGNFTHEQLAVFNQRTKPQVYLQLREAITKGEVILMEKLFGGRGKPTNVYSLAGEKPVEVKVVPAFPTDTEGLKLIPPTTQDRNFLPADTKIVEDKLCPLCKAPLFTWADETGIMLWCNNKDCIGTENPFGHANTINNAYEVIQQKYGDRK